MGLITLARDKTLGTNEDSFYAIVVTKNRIGITQNIDLLIIFDSQLENLISWKQQRQRPMRRQELPQKM